MLLMYKISSANIQYNDFYDKVFCVDSYGKDFAYSSDDVEIWEVTLNRKRKADDFNSSD